jgi:hypothetical protein
VSDPRTWECPGCAATSSSSTAVWRRYCPSCGVWCKRVDDGSTIGISFAVWSDGEAEAVKLIEQVLRQPGARPMVRA